MMKITKREFQISDEVGILYVVYFTDSKGRKKYMVTRIDDKHIVYTEQFLESCLQCLKLHGELNEDEAV